MTNETIVAHRVDVDHLADRLQGRGGGLRKSKPTTDADDGLTQYVWRMARFHSGADTSMPVTASWWLQDWLDQEGIEASVSGIVDEDGERVTDELEAVTDRVLDELGLPTTGAADRYQGVLY